MFFLEYANIDFLFDFFLFVFFPIWSLLFLIALVLDMRARRKKQEKFDKLYDVSSSLRRLL